jgi:membrane protein YdbS with pleckstrin-like domain
MSNLSNLYISQSFFGVVNLENAELSLSSSVGDTQLQDGVGTNLGLIINSGSNTITLDRNVNVSDNLIVSGNAEFSGSIIHTGSLDVFGDITASGNIKATIGNFDTINTRVLHVTEESASVIFSSGSNILGDEASDVQTLNGTVNIPNLEFLAGNVVDTDTRINNLNTFTSSQESINSNLNTFSASVIVEQAVQDQRLDSLETYTGSLDLQYVLRAEYNVYTASTDSRLNNIELETGSIEAEQVVQNNQLSNIEQTTASLQTEVDGLSTFTGSIEAEQVVQDDRLNQLSVETGSIQTEIDGLSNATSSYARKDIGNTFTANNVFSGSVQGECITVPIVSLTATMDCSLGNFFKLTLPASVNTDITAINIVPGLTTTLEINQPAVGTGTVTFNSTSLSFPRFSQPVITATTGAKDIATFVSFDSTKLNGALTNDLI